MGVEPGFDGGEVGEDGAAVEEGAGGVAEVEGVVFPDGICELGKGEEGREGTYMWDWAWRRRTPRLSWSVMETSWSLATTCRRQLSICIYSK